MIIYPAGQQLIRFEDAIAGLNRSPKVGDEGHVDDHARLSQVMFDIPQTAVGLGFAYRNEGQWHLNKSSDYEVQPQVSTWEEVSDYVDRVGVAAMPTDAHPAADGVTDWVEDSDDLDGVAFYIVAAGVVGLSYAVAELAQQVQALKAAQA